MGGASSIPDFLRDNISWLFSGIGVFVLSLFVSRLRYSRGRSTSNIRLTSPRFGAHVPRVTLVTGMVAPPTANVIVVVHPMATDQYWPQRKVSVRNDGTWAVEVLVGSVQ